MRESGILVRQSTLGRVAVWCCVAWSWASVAATGAFAGAEPAAGTPTAEFPQAVVANERLKITVYLPDAERGFYRGSRFDWSGLVARAEFDGRTVFRPFRARHDPAGHDHVVGPAEEFDMDAPPGYADARPGETFMKIGVGMLEKVRDEQYAFSRKYRIADGGRWHVSRGDGWVEFRHELRGAGRGYVYTKRLALDADRPALAVTHALRNTAEKVLETVTYCHNFVVIDDEPVGPNYRVVFPFDLSAAPEKKRGKAELRGREVVMPEPLSGSVWIEFEGGRDAIPADGVFIENRRTGTALRILIDQPVAQWRFYAERSAACPEPFIRIVVPPGQERTWTTRYVFQAAPAPVAPDRSM